jgi:H+/Cl- antiporter ClcA
LTPRVWLTLVATGLSAGLYGDAKVSILHVVQDLAYHASGDGFGHAASLSTGTERIVALLAGGVVTAVGLAVVGRWTRAGRDLDDAVWRGSGDLPFLRTLGRGALSEVSVGVGASLGQEAAPKALGAAAGSLLARRVGLDARQARLVVACGAGAGMGAVYNVPLGGAVLAAELLLGSLALTVMLPALVSAGVATVVAWGFNGAGPTYVGLPTMAPSWSLVVWSLVAGPALGAFGVLVVRGVGWVSHFQVRGRSRLVAVPVAFVVVGLAALRFPSLLGNGKSMADAALNGERLALTAGIVLVLLKPLLTMLCLWSGASGGLFTPVLSTGATMGLLGAEAWDALHLGAVPLAPAAVVGAAALTGATMQAPLAAVVLIIELTGNTQGLLLPVVLATATATLVARYLDGYSVFSARLPALEAV